MIAGVAPTVPLAGGAAIPAAGFGTWPMVGDEARAAVDAALEAGYRLIDTSEQYGNEQPVGQALRESGLPRGELFVTTKFNRRWHGRELVREACCRSLERLGLDYVDLLLIHWPNPWLGRYVSAWEGMLELREEGLVQAAGVSNFSPAHIDELLKATGTPPEVNQIELDPTLPRHDWRAYHAQHGIVTEAWSPLGRGGEMLRAPLILELARSYNRTPAQVILRWHVDMHVIPVARSSNPSRMAENLTVFDFRLSAEDRAKLATLDRGRAPARDPETHGH